MFADGVGNMFVWMDFRELDIEYLGIRRTTNGSLTSCRLSPSPSMVFSINEQSDTQLARTMKKPHAPTVKLKILLGRRQHG